MINQILAVILAYLLGSIPFGLLVTRMAGAGDIRKIGSGNIGATNVLRTGNKVLAAATLLLDMLKGVLAVWLAAIFAPEAQAAAGLFALLGHMFPVWLDFKGGKGVATALGVMLALSPGVALMAMLTWLATAYLMRISSLSALVAVATMPVFISIFQQPELLSISLLIILLVFAKHYPNIRRLIDGTEPKIGEKKEEE